MSEFSHSEKHPLAVRAEQLILDEPDPARRAHLMAVAIEEGLFIPVADFMDVISQISDEDERSPYRVSDYQTKYYLVLEAVKALAAQKRFAGAPMLLDYLKMTSNYTYHRAMIHLVKNGYFGQDDEFLWLTAQDIVDGRTFDPENLKHPSKYASDPSTYQMYLHDYLEALAEAGIDVHDGGLEFGRIQEIITSIDQLEKTDPWQHQRRTHGIASAYLRGGHTEKARIWRDKIEDPALVAEWCLEAAKATDDEDEIVSLLSEAREATIRASRCTGSCGYGHHCNPERSIRELSIAYLGQFARMHNLAAQFAKTELGEPKFYHPDKQLGAYLELYRELGDEESRSYAIGFLNDMIHDGGNRLMYAVMDIAKLDVKWGRVMSSPETSDEPVPLIAWEIEKIFWGIDKLKNQMLGIKDGDQEYNSSDDRDGQNEIDKKVSEALGMQTEADDETHFGPSSRSWGEEYIQHDLEACQKQRDAAFGKIASMLASEGHHMASQYFLDKIDGAEGKIRAYLSVARS